MTDIQRLPFRVENRLALALGLQEADLSVVEAGSGVMPSVRCLLRRPATTDTSILLRVHTSAGIPVAFSKIDVARGDSAFETQSLTLFAMEGYSHLSPADRQNVEARVWSRRAYATVTTA